MTGPANDGSYGADNIDVLEGLEAVRRRPGMYIGSTGLTGLHHLIREVVDNSVDEAMAGHCDRIEVTLLADGGCRVADNGRGIPVEAYTKGRHRGKSTLEVIMTVLHAGGKFGGGGYKVSGGLHGVGVSVVNALSSRLIVEVDKNSQRHRLDFVDGGKPVGKVQVIGPAPRGRTGTTVTFWPDAEVFASEGVEFRAQTVIERLQTYAFLNKGLEIRFKDERPGATPEHREVTFKYAGGIADFVRHLNASRDALFSRVGHYEVSDGESELEIAFQWNTAYYEGIHSYVNGIETTEGGTHEEGFRKALTNVVNRYARAKGLLKDKDDNLSGEDIREGLTCIIAVRIQDPQFEGQTKSKLGTISVRSTVERATNDKLAEWLEEHPPEGNKIVKKAIEAFRARVAAKSARDATRRKSALEGAGLPGKLTDCRTKNAADAELFIVEGDSAGGSAIRARNPENQAILPIRGKFLNVERARIDKMLKNIEVQAMISAIGAGLGDEFDVTKIRYGKIIILADADVDGSHIRTLLLTFFFRQMRPLIEGGHVYVAQPPLYSTLVGKETVYLKDDLAKAAFNREHPNHRGDFARLKGLGEMDFDELGATTMDIAGRTLLQVNIEQAALADEVCSILMGDDVDLRKHFIVTNAKDVRFLDI